LRYASIRTSIRHSGVCRVFAAASWTTRMSSI
jgi:hypothetical protein